MSSSYNIIISTAETTVVSEYEPQIKRSDAYQSEEALENAFINCLENRGTNISLFTKRKILSPIFANSLSYSTISVLQIRNGKPSLELRSPTTTKVS